MLRTLLTSTTLMLSIGAWAQADTATAFDVAEDHTRIHMASAPLHENGMPAHGNAFISQGYIYPAGTLEAGTTGVLEDGSPAFPNLVLGTWTCDGYFVGEGANTETGVWIISRQVFAFADGDTIVTQGTEIVDTGVDNLRPITGATGDYANVSGAMVQTLLGFSEQMTVNVSFRLVPESLDRASISTVTEASEIQEAAMRETDRGYTQDVEHNHLEWDSGAPVGPIFNDEAIPST